MSWLDEPFLIPSPPPPPPVPAQPQASTQGDSPRPEPRAHAPTATGPVSMAWTLAPWLIAALAVLWAWRQSPPGPGPNPDPVPVETLSVLILEETADRGTLPAGQTAILNSVDIREAIARRGGQLRVLDVDDKTDTLGDPWPTLRSRATLKPPLVIFAEKRRAIETALPADVPAMLQRLEEFQP